MPPGTGDAYLTVASEIKPDYALLVTTANKLAVHDLQKSIILFNKLDIKMMGFIGNNIANTQETNDFESIKGLGISHISSIPFNLDIYNSKLNNLPSCFDDISKSIEELV
jgi:ATP-binding protein involved in chromosome partitioning